MINRKALEDFEFLHLVSTINQGLCLCN